MALKNIKNFVFSCYWIRIIPADRQGLLFFSESAATASEAARTSAWACSGPAATTARTSAEAEGILTAAEQVQTVDDMQHAIAGDGVVFGIGATHRRDGTAEGGLLVQDVVELQGDGEGLTLEESL